MGAESWLSGIEHAALLFADSIPDAIGLAYSWAKEWQGLLGGMLLVFAAWIFTRGSLRAARIRAAALVRSAEITARVAPASELGLSAVQTVARVARERSQPTTPEDQLLKKVEQLRSLIRSAMSTLASDAGNVHSAPNFYCERISLMNFEAAELPDRLTPPTRDLYKKLVSHLAMVRQATEKKVPQAELSNTLVQLNARAREFLAAISALPASTVAPETTRMKSLGS